MTLAAVRELAILANPGPLVGHPLPCPHKLCTFLICSAYAADEKPDPCTLADKFLGFP
jgi:hypothetical protein